MNIVEVNTCDNGSTGKIMLGIAQTAAMRGVSVSTFSLKPKTPETGKTKPTTHHYFSSFYEYALHYVLGYLTGLNGCFSQIGTFLLLRKIKKEDPDILQLHNLHNCYINLPMLFHWIKKENIAVVWTLHDCWAFTGQCPYFDIAGCDKWKTGCFDCPQYREYPEACIDRTKTMWKLKKRWFTDVKNMNIVTPSQWLADLVKQSYLNEYPVSVINNGIDLSIFKPTAGNFREKYGMTGKYIVLGVAYCWEKRKGIDVFIELAKRLDERFQIVIVGTDDETDKLLSPGVCAIHRTQGQKELAEIYSAADVFVNPTREENFPTVNMEALACGTPVLTFRTGGSPEIADESTGCTVDRDNIDAMEKEIIRICEDKPYSAKACLDRASVFDQNEKYREYMQLYLEICGGSNGKEN